MFKKIILTSIFCLSLFSFPAYASETITITTDGYQSINSGDSFTITAEYGGSCSNIEFATINWLEQNITGDWIIVQTGDFTNTSYTSTTTFSKVIKTQINCPLGHYPTFIANISDEASTEIDVSIYPTDPIVSAGVDATYSSGATVNLTGTISGTDCETFDYQWEQITGPTIAITNSGQTLVNSKTYDSASFVFPETDENIELKLNISPQSCFHSGNTYSDNVVYTKESTSSGGGRSWAAQMQDEAISIFTNSEKLEAVNLILNLTQGQHSSVMYFDWNSLGGESEINYILEYSTQADFPTENIQTIETKSFHHTFYKFYLNTKSLIHYFRIKAEYQGKTTKYSNTVKHYSEDYLTVRCPINQKKTINFSDIFLEYGFLIDEYLVPKCLKCENKIEL